ncbi:MAG: CPBP family intramembrane glutamic endopeptidase [Patescibacteria group bacterium]
MLITKNLQRLLIYYLYLIVAWGLFRYFVRLPEVVTELWFKPVIWLVPLYWWRLALKGEPKLFAGKIRPALGWGLLGGLIYFGVLRLLTNSGFSLDSNRIGIAGVTAVVEELTFAGVFLSILVKETKREGVSLAITGLAFAAIHLPRQIFIFSLAPSLLVGAFSLAFFVGLINGFLRLRSNNVLAAIVAHFVFLVLAL